MTDPTPAVPDDPADPESDALPVDPDADQHDRDEIEEGVGEMLEPPPPEGGPVSDTDAEPTL